MEKPTYSNSGYSGYSMADSAVPEGQPARKRARQACLACNARRVKCNVTETHPCDNCVQNSSICETRESRRGKHPRPSKKRRDTISTIDDNSQHPDDVAASHVLASLHKPRDSNGTGQELPGIASFTTPDHHQSTPQVLQDSRREDDDDVFLGETTALRYVQDESKSASLPGIGIRLRHAVPKAARAEYQLPEWEVNRASVRIEYLRADGAFSFPPSNVVEGLLKAYFRWFHPCFAIVDEVDIWNQYRHHVLSPLLLQAMLFVGILHCDEPVLQDLGFGTRHRAKYVFYNRAKDIYDAEYERKKLTVIQALFLMSFWRAGALLEKDTRHWLGCAISLGQTKALHRSAGKADDQAKKLRRRIWWSLYTRDRQCAAALGLPNRVRDEDCDFEPLEPSDFEYAFSPTLSREGSSEYASHAIAMTELATFLGKIVHIGYLPNKILNSSHRAQVRDELLKWKQHLPPAMQPENDFGPHPGLHGNMQHLAYNNLLILLYRQAYINGEQGQDGEVVVQAASRNSRIVEDMLSEGTLRHAQIHVITNLFNTLCIHTVHLRRSEGTTRAVAEHRAKLCLLGLKELQKTWEVTNWVLQLFFQYLDRATAVQLRVQEDDGLLPSIAQVATAATQAAGLTTTAVDELPQPQALNAFPQSEALSSATDGGFLGATPWSWTSDEQNQFLFQQIEGNEFAFGEGEMLDWTTDEGNLGQDLFHSHDIGSNFLP